MAIIQCVYIINDNHNLNGLFNGKNKSEIIFFHQMKLDDFHKKLEKCTYRCRIECRIHKYQPNK